jgi:hypothetical protein
VRFCREPSSPSVCIKTGVITQVNNISYNSLQKTKIAKRSQNSKIGTLCGRTSMRYPRWAASHHVTSPCKGLVTCAHSPLHSISWLFYLNPLKFSNSSAVTPACVIFAGVSQHHVAGSSKGLVTCDHTSPHSIFLPFHLSSHINPSAATPACVIFTGVSQHHVTNSTKELVTCDHTQLHSLSLYFHLKLSNPNAVTPACVIFAGVPQHHVANSLTELVTCDHVPLHSIFLFLLPHPFLKSSFPNAATPACVIFAGVSQHHVANSHKELVTCASKFKGDKVARPVLRPLKSDYLC